MIFKQSTGKTAKCFLEIPFSGLKHLLSHTFYLYMANFASNGKKQQIVSFNSNYYLFLNRDTGILTYFLHAFTLLLLKKNSGQGMPYNM